MTLVFLQYVQIFRKIIFSLKKIQFLEKIPSFLGKINRTLINGSPLSDPRLKILPESITRCVINGSMLTIVYSQQMWRYKSDHPHPKVQYFSLCSQLQPVMSCRVESLCPKSEVDENLKWPDIFCFSEEFNFLYVKEQRRLILASAIDTVAAAYLRVFVALFVAEFFQTYGLINTSGTV